MATSSGTSPPSMRRRVKSNSIWEAEGKPTSISLNPILTSISKNSIFSSTLIGCARAWLPSRRSTLHQVGARVIVRFGHWRSGRGTGGRGRISGQDLAACRGRVEIGGNRAGAQRRPGRRDGRGERGEPGLRTTRRFAASSRGRARG